MLVWQIIERKILENKKKKKIIWPGAVSPNFTCKNMLEPVDSWVLHSLKAGAVLQIYYSGTWSSNAWFSPRNCKSSLQKYRLHSKPDFKGCGKYTSRLFVSPSYHGKVDFIMGAIRIQLCILLLVQIQHKGIYLYRCTCLHNQSLQG